MRDKKKQAYRHTSLRLPKEDLTWLNQECAHIGISLSTAFRWLVEQAKTDGLKPPAKPPA